MFQCLLCILSSLLMLLPSLISFLVRSLYISYYPYWVSVSFCFLIFAFFDRGPWGKSSHSLFCPFLASLCAKQVQHSIFLFLHFILRCSYISICFPVYQLSTAICVLVFLLLPASYFSRPPCKKPMEAHFFLITIFLSKKKKLKGLWSLQTNWDDGLVDLLFGLCPLILRDKLTWSLTLRK